MTTKKHVSCITVNTDASFHPEKKVGGYAFYIICDSFKIQKSGMLKQSPSNSIEAEMMCIANALHVLSNQIDLPTAKWIIINTDCLFAIPKITKKSKDPIGRRVYRILKTVKNKTAYKEVIYPKVQFRHVKAHSGVDDARSHVNEWCDTEAKKWMRLAAIKYDNQEEKHDTRRKHGLRDPEIKVSRFA